MSDYNFISNMRARCENVVDGDTADLRVDLGFHCFRIERFRLLEINAPEMHGPTHDAGLAAKEALKAMLERPGQWPLRIVTKPDPDSFGRWLAEIYFMDNEKETWVNGEMVASGHAVWFMRDKA